jgi:hypothetical protein
MFERTKCPICRQKFTDHSELQWKICKVITIKEFSGNCLGFDLEYGSPIQDDI